MRLVRIDGLIEQIIGFDEQIILTHAQCTVISCTQIQHIMAIGFAFKSGQFILIKHPIILKLLTSLASNRLGSSDPLAQAADAAYIAQLHGHTQALRPPDKARCQAYL